MSERKKGFSKPVTKIYKKNTEICSTGNIERNVYLLKSGIVEAGMIVNGEERIIDFIFSESYTASFPLYLRKQNLTYT